MRVEKTQARTTCPNGSIFRVVGKRDENLEINCASTFGEVYITEELDVVGKDLIQYFFTLMSNKRSEVQLNHSMYGIEVTVVEEASHSGNGLADENFRNHSIGEIEVTDMGSRSGFASTTRSSLKDDSTHSTDKNIIVEEDTVAYCAVETDRKIPPPPHV
ncbi:hypothetical protein PRIPAC_72199 [Pristionchus pacificus]|uniref:Uncharacterized protein n=1 Tax=Pristionchus pacificus TaxID=54126 RepID=A0A2A6BFD7_PRIPA|nr:hypothetical protein PRIPAC_72199 [Pristionchus pacificus]|eukprot:PDM64578.1 hypothetical protein PRIPAC_52834 [Pristionchus pacificus]